MAFAVPEQTVSRASQPEAPRIPREVKGVLSFQVDPRTQLITGADMKGRLYLGLPPGKEVPPNISLGDVLPTAQVREGIEQHYRQLTEGKQDEATTLIETGTGRFIQVTTQVAHEQTAAGTYDKDKPVLYDTLCVDVTETVQKERRAAQEKINAAEDKAAAANNAAVRIAHDARSPASNIMSYAEFLLETDPQDRMQMLEESLQAMSRSANRITDLSQGYLDLARFESGEVAIDPVPVNMKDVVGNLEVQFKPEQERTKAAITFQEDIPTPMGVPFLVQQALANYISNALKYAGQNPVVEVKAHSIEGGKIRFEVQDHGNGIPSDRQEKLFTKFGVLGLPEHSGIKGSGIGLNLVKQIIEAQGGVVGVESEVGKGSTFYFILDAAPSAAAEQK